MKSLFLCGGVILLLSVSIVRAADCGQLEKTFAGLDESFRMARTIKSPSARYDYYYRYIVAGSKLLAWCRNDRRNYQYAEVVRKLRSAECQRAGLRQKVIEEQWRVHGIKPIVNVVYQSCNY